MKSAFPKALMTNSFYQESLSSCSTTCVHWRCRKRFEKWWKLSWSGYTGRSRGH